MDEAYGIFGQTIGKWAVRNYANTRFEPEEYFLFGNNRLLLSSLSTSNYTAAETEMIKSAVIGFAYHRNLYVPDEDAFDGDAYKGFWMLLQDRATNKTSLEKCDNNWNTCTKDFDQKVKLTGKDTGFRGIMLQGPKDQIKRFSPNEKVSGPPHWNFMNWMYSLAGQWIATNNEYDFDTFYVADES
jgi:hypothetical protein